MDKPIFILGCTKSGTTLMRNLFDGHPDFFVIPTESHFFQHTRRWVSYYTRKTKPQDVSIDNIKKNMVSWIELSNSITQKITDAFTEGKWNIDLFKETIFSKETNNLRELFDLYIRAIYKSLYGKDLNTQLNFVEKSVENAEFAFELKTMYPDAKFVHIIRNPYSNIVAFRKYISINRFPYLKGLLFSMYNSYYYLMKNIDFVDNYHVVVYEDLISNPEKTMRDLTDSLNIPFNEKLLFPSLMGENWGGNSTSNEKFTGVSNKNIDKWKSEITSFEINLVNSLFKGVLEKFNFDIVNPSKSIYFPAKKESPYKYLMNRMLWVNFPRF
ncbi:MAG: hypothetical protein C0599_05440 [Salinivirgaceae bacterium]|nr:MAG: hypothetical protein C0599_05440 [Salinivirgaceae bacterium]